MLTFSLTFSPNKMLLQQILANPAPGELKQQSNRKHNESEYNKVLQDLKSNFNLNKAEKTLLDKNTKTEFIKHSKIEVEAQKILKEVHDKNMFFVLSTGRSGTKTIAESLSMLPDCLCLHEPSPQLIFESSAYRYGRLEGDRLKHFLLQTRKPVINGKVYGESNQTLSLIVPVLAKSFPKAKFIWLIRNGLDVVSSIYSRQWYTGHSANHRRYEDCPPIEKAWIDGRIMGDLCGDVPLARWKSMNQFARCCWYWAYVNRTIEKDLRKHSSEGNYRKIKLEELAKELPSIVDWLGFDQPMKQKTGRYNRAHYKLYPWQEWTLEERKTFLYWCGPLMDRIYPDWRTSSQDFFDYSKKTPKSLIASAGGYPKHQRIINRDDSPKVKSDGLDIYFTPQIKSFPKISVYITSYNQKEYLLEAIESVLAQSLKPHEIIIVDDCSNDESQELIAKYAQKYQNLIFPIYHTKNFGVVQTRLDALNAITGDYVTYVDGDDRFLPQKLENEFEILVGHPNAQIAFSNNYYISPAGQRIGLWAEEEKPRQGFIFKETFGRIFPKNSLFRMELINYQALKAVGFHDPAITLYEDFDLRIRMTKHFQAVFCDEPLSEIRMHEKGLSKLEAKQHLASLEFIYHKNSFLLEDLSQTERKIAKKGFYDFVDNISRVAANQLAEEPIRKKQNSDKQENVAITTGSKKGQVKGQNELGSNLIFLISQPRAGSTLLQRVLAGHPQIHTTAEPWIMLHPLYALKESGIIAEYRADLAQQGLVDFLGQVPEGIKLYKTALRQFGLILYNRALEMSKKRFFLDKTPRYYHIIAELYSIFPEAHFIFLLRNPIAVLSSVLKTWYGNCVTGLQINTLIDLVKGPVRLLDGIKKLKEKAIVVEYESLVQFPETVMLRVCNRIGIPFYADMLDYGQKTRPKGRFGDSVGIYEHQRPFADNIDKWLKNISSPELEEFAKHYLKDLGPEIVSKMGYSFNELKEKLSSKRKIDNTHNTNLDKDKLLGQESESLCTSNAEVQNGSQQLRCGKKDGDLVESASSISVQEKDFSEQFLVSAIVSTYNAEQFIHGCLEDLECQTIANRLEIIVVDSGSQQSEEKIIKKFQDKYKNIKYLKTNQRETVYGSWNRGIKAATGKYITNANTDDRHRADAFEIMVRALEENPSVGAVYADTLITDKENETFKNNTARQYFNRPKFNLRQMLLFSFFGPQPMWRRSVHQRIGFFDASLSVAGDYEFFIRLARESGALHIGEILGLYTCRNSSIENGNRGRCVSETLQILKRYRNTIPLEDFYPDLKSEKEPENAFAACLADQGNCCLFGGLPDIESALTYYNLAFENGYTEPELAANLGVALWLSGKQGQGMDLLKQISDKVRPAAHNATIIKQCLAKGELPQISKFEVAEIYHPVIAAACRGKGIIIEDDRFVPIETIEKNWVGSNMIRKFPQKINGQAANLARTPQVSVIVRTMNRPLFLEECLTSLSAQTFKDFEVVVINDGGINVDDVIEKFSQQMLVLYKQHLSNQGRSAALNTGLKCARGKYIAYLDDDDRVFPDHLEILVMELETGVFRIVYSDSFEVRQEPFNGSYKTVRKRVVYSNDYDRDLLRKTNYIPILNLMHHRDCAVKIGFFDEDLTVLEDWDYWIRLSEHYDFKHIPKITAEYRVRTDYTNATATEAQQFPVCREKIRAKLASLWPSPIRRVVKPMISMVILTCNQLEYTRKCLDSIFQHTQRSFELIIIDNGSTDGTVEFLESEIFGNGYEASIKIVKNYENKGFAGGNNQGMAAASGEYILLLNNDVVVTDGWLERMVACAEKQPVIGIVGPRSNYVSGPQLVERVDYDTSTLKGLNEFSNKFAANHAAQAQRVLRVVGFCMLIKRAVIDKIGGMDDCYGLGNFEDDDFSLRATIAGFESWIALDCFVHHFGHRTFIGEKVDLRKSLQKNWIIFKNKWGLPAAKPYGSPYRLSEMINTRFDPALHYYPLDRAETIMEKFDDEFQSAESLYAAIQSNLSTRSSKEVIEDLENLIASYPAFALAYNDLGVLYYDAGNKVKAHQFYEKAVHLDPEGTVFQKNLADFYYAEMGRVEEALRIYVKVLEANPKDVETLLITGHICVSLHKFEDAKVFYRRVLELEPENDDARNNLTKLDQMQFIDLEVKSPEEMYQEIQPVLDNDDPHKAIAALERLLERFPNFAAAHNDLGVLFYQMGDKEKAQHRYERAVELMPGNINFLKNLADFYCVEMGRIEDALQIYLGILESHRDDVEILLNTGRICRALKKLEEAKGFYERVITLEPDNEDATKNLQALIKQQIEQLSARLNCLNIANDSNSKSESADLHIEESEKRNTEPKTEASIIVRLDGIQSRLKECLKSIQAHTLEPHELILVARGATKGMLKWAQQLVKDNEHYYIVECAEQKSWTECINQAILKANGQIVVLIHNDVVLAEGWLSAFVKCINLEPNCGVVGPMTNRTVGIQQIVNTGKSDRTEFETAAKAFYEQNQYRRVRSLKLSDFCLVFRRDLIDNIGTFDEQFISEEVAVEDFCARAVSASFQNLVAADIYVFHYDRHPFKNNALVENSAHAENRKKYQEKWNTSQTPQAETFQVVQLIARAAEIGQSGKVGAAVEVLLGGIGVRPEDPQLYIALTRLLIAAKRFQDAKETLAEMPTGDIHREILKSELQAYAEEGLRNYEAAQEHIEKALAMTADRAAALNLKGLLAYHNGDRGSAEKLFQRAMETDPGYGEPYNNLGMLLSEADRLQDAVKFLEKAFRLTPADFDIATNYHSLIAGIGDFEKAEDAAREAAALYPHNQKIKYMLIDLLIQQGKYNEAMTDIEAAIVKFGIEDGILAAAVKIREKLGPMTIQPNSQKAPVSLCMIIKDEEKYLARCLASVKPVVDEMIVVDTGSTDRSKDIAITFGAKVYEYEWQEDFAAPRNYSISKASGDWILILDGDEVISPLDYDLFNKIVRKKPKAPIAYSITTRNYNQLANIVGWIPNDGQYPDEEAAIGWLASEKVRLFYGRKQIWFEGAVHELVDPVLKRKGIEIKKCCIPVHHYGRLDKKKLDRKGEIYFDIGQKKLAKMGEDINALRELATQATILERNQEALELWQRLLSLNPFPGLAAIAYVNMGSIYNRLGKFEDALEVGKKGVENDSNLKEAQYNLAMAELHCGNAHHAISILNDLLNGFPDYPPARFILSAAYCCADQKEKGLDGIRNLKITPLGAHLEVPCIELGHSLLSANQIKYALGVLGAAIECDIVNKEILDLFNQCIKMHEDNQRLSEMGPTVPNISRTDLFEHLFQ